jgi:hypothetical protein
MADNLATFMCRLSKNTVILNLLEPEGTVHTCIGKAFPLPLLLCLLVLNETRRIVIIILQS